MSKKTLKKKAAKRTGLWLMFAAYCVLALVVAAYLAQTPSFQSELSIVLPGAGGQSSVKLEELGQVSSSTPSAYSQAHNPRSNYKAILISDALRSEVASKLGINAEFALPKVELLQQTSIIQLKLRGAQPEQAQALAWGYFNALQEQLERLRLDEASRRQDGVAKALDSYASKLNKTRQAIIDFQQRSELVSNDQMPLHMATQARVREQLTFARSEAQSVKLRVQQLSSDLGVSPKLAAHALTLQTDARFGGYLRELSLTSTEYSQYRSQWGSNHPKVKSSRQRYITARANLKKRSGEVVGEFSGEILQGMNLSASLNLAELFAQLLNDSAELQGIQAKISNLDLADQRLQDQLRLLSREAAELDRLRRDFQRAETVYNSAAAKLEVAQADIFSSYPVIQLLTPPSSPLVARSPSTMVAVLAGLLGFIFITFTGVIVWQRQRIVRFLLKND